MGKSYSDDLRDRIVGYVSAGGSRCGAAKHFGGSFSCTVKLLARLERTGSSSPARQGRPPGDGKPAHCPFRIEQVEAKPDITLPQLAGVLEVQRGVAADPSSLSRVLSAGWYWVRAPVSFAGKRVGLVCAGSTGIQIVPEVAKTAGTLIVFQRTPSPRHGRPFQRRTTWWRPPPG